MWAGKYVSLTSEVAVYDDEFLFQLISKVNAALIYIHGLWTSPTGYTSLQFTNKRNIDYD
jgi:hypothetical protein